MREWFMGFVRLLAVASVATGMMSCVGTDYSVTTGIQHQSLGTDLEGELSGWGAGATIGVLSRNGRPAIEMCGVGGLYFGANVADLSKEQVVTNVNVVPLEMCSTIPLGRRE